MIDTNEIRFVMKDDDYELTDHLVYALCDEIDRLRGEQQTPTQGRTVRVPVLAERFGKTHETEYFVVLPVPAETVVEAKVEVENG